MNTSVDANAERYTAKEKQVAMQARDYLKKHKMWMSETSWQFDKNALPSKEVAKFVKKFLLAWAADIFDTKEIEEMFLENAIELIESEWSLDHDEGKE